MNTNQVLAQHYGSIFKAHQIITTLSQYEMVCYLQKQFNHKENDIDFNQKDEFSKAFRLLTSENTEMRNEGLIPKNITKMRDAIGDQITVAFFLCFKINGLKYESFHHISPLIPSSYSEYCDQVDNALEQLKEACFEKNDASLAQDKMNNYLACLYTPPSFSAFNINDDLLDITLSSLSKVCIDEEVAKKTLAAYQERNYIAHIEKVPSGFGIFVSEDCIIKGEKIPKGKFLKSLFLIDTLLPEINENSIW